MLSIYYIHLNILKLFFVVNLITNAESASQTFEACITPNNTNGQCINIRKCPALLNLIDPNSKENVQYLRRANCGYENLDPKICCSLLTQSENIPPTQQWIPPNEETLKKLPTAYLLPSLETCGPHETLKIRNGVAADLGEYPWMALLQYQTTNSRSFHCGGALINNRYVLTAAHCVDQEALPTNWILVGVRLGEHNTTTNPDCLHFDDKEQCAPPVIDVEISEKIVHPNYAAGDRNRYGDIALLRLDSEISYSFYVTPICLPIIQNLLEKDYAGENMMVAGWGQTEKPSPSSDIKLKLQLPVKSNAECYSQYRDRGVTLKRSQICAGGLRDQDSCKGDSGGPLMSLHFAEDYNWYAIGIVSFGPEDCGQEGFPGIYTRVSDYMDWIINNLKP